MPQWPRLLPPNGTLLSPRKKEGSHPLVIDGPFPAATELRLHVLTVSIAAVLVVEADGKQVFEKKFQCGPGEGEWKKAEFKPQYKIYQNLYDRDYTATIPAGTQQVRVRVADGDWLQIGEIGLKPATAARPRRRSTLKQDLGKKPGADPLRTGPAGRRRSPASPMQDRAWLWKTCIEPWKEAEAQGIGVMVGEWGAFNKTPHDVFLRWAEDCLSNWQKAGWGWAMWNFRGSFGVLDSGRADVQYEEFEGHQARPQAAGPAAAVLRGLRQAAENELTTLTKHTATDLRYLRPKSAGFSPQCSVSHLSSGFGYVWLASQMLGAVEEIEEPTVCRGARQFGVGLLLAHPGQRGPRIRVDGTIASLLNQQRQSVDDGQELADVHGAFRETDRDGRFACRRLVCHAAILEIARIAAARGVHADAVQDHSVFRQLGRRQTVLSLCSGLRTARSPGRTPPARPRAWQTL